MDTPENAIRDFLHAVDHGYFGSMPAGFHESAFVKALRLHVKEPPLKFDNPFREALHLIRRV